MANIFVELVEKCFGIIDGEIATKDRSFAVVYSAGPPEHGWASLHAIHASHDGQV